MGTMSSLVPPVVPVPVHVPYVDVCSVLLAAINQSMIRVI
jgi:hypothetical protein